MSEFPLEGPQCLDFLIWTSGQCNISQSQPVPCNISGGQRPRVLLLAPYLSVPRCHQSALCFPFPSSHPGLSQTIQLFLLSAATNRPLGTTSVAAVLESHTATWMPACSGTRVLRWLLSNWLPGSSPHLQNCPFIRGRILAGVRGCLDGIRGLSGSIKCVLPCCCWLGPRPPSASADAC